MVFTSRISLFACLLVIGVTNAFVLPSLVARPSSSLSSASMGTTEAEGTILAKQFQRMEQDQLWEEQLQTPQIQQVRDEMLQKYLSLGKSTDKAEQEVDAFLRDRERAQPFIEMRQYAKRKFDDMGLEIVFQSAAIMFFCLFTTLALQYHAAYVATYAPGTGPIPFW